MALEFVQTSVVRAPQAAVWEFVTQPEGINHELWPVLTMTVPRGAAGLNLADVEAPIQLGKSWLLLGTLIPLDYDDIGIVELDKGSRFKEQSTMLSMKAWGHERSIAAHPDGCTVTDRITFTSRIPGLDRVMAPILRWLFRHRHKRLQAHFA